MLVRIIPVCPFFLSLSVGRGVFSACRNGDGFWFGLFCVIGLGRVGLGFANAD